MRSTRPSRLLLGVAAVAALGSLLAAPGALGAKGKKKPKSPPVTVVSASTPTADDQVATATATCPAGKVAVGGGFLSPANIVGGTVPDLLIVYESRRIGDNAWQAAAIREDTGPAGPDLPITASVHCRTPRLSAKKKAGKKAAPAKKRGKKLRITEVSASQVAPGMPGTQADATATCPAGTQALGGGFSSSPAPSFSGGGGYPLFWASYRTSPGTWRSAFTHASAIPRTVTSYAYCASGLKIAETSASSALAPSSGGASTGLAVTPACTKRRALLGGGFSNTPIASGTGLALLSSSSAAASSWHLGATNLSSNPGTIGSFGYCA